MTFPKYVKQKISKCATKDPVELRETTHVFVYFLRTQHLIYEGYVKKLRWTLSIILQSTNHKIKVKKAILELGVKTTLEAM